MKFLLLPSLLVITLVGCAMTPSSAERASDQQEEDPMLADTRIDYAVVHEAFVSAATPQDNIDSPAVWRAPDGETWLIATAKEGKSGLVVYDGDTGAIVRTVGGKGKALGEFNRPNGIFVHDALLFVVERDNRRVQVLSLPQFKPLGSFGEDTLQLPYGLWLHAGVEPGSYDVLVTDAYMAGNDAQGEDIIPPLDQLDRRVHRYQISVSADAVRAKSVGTFGDTGQAGSIRVPESIWGDPDNHRLLIAEEDVATGTAVRDYTLAGQYRGRTIGLDLFKAQAEGIALCRCDDGRGYWIATDQYKDRSLFHVFERNSLDHVGAFAGNTIANTDGVWLQQTPSTRFPAGAFYAVHDDQAVGAFDWRDVAKALKLPESCTSAS